MVKLLELTDRPKTVGFQADMAHTLLYTLASMAARDHRAGRFNGIRTFSTNRCAADHRAAPWTIDFHVAQNDATVHGTSSHDKTGRHCQVNDPNGKLNIDYHAGFWLREENGKLTKAVQHICWDGCMFPNAVMHNQQTWNDILKSMITVRDAHGWDQPTGKPAAKSAAVITTKPKKAKAVAKKIKKAAKAKAKKTVKKATKKRK